MFYMHMKEKGNAPEEDHENGLPGPGDMGE